MTDNFYSTFEEHIEISKKTASQEVPNTILAAELCIKAIQKGNKILIFGNGGSAGDAQHIAAELVGRYKLNRRGLPCIALTTDTSTITAVSNDFGYSSVFERQVEALAVEGDIVIGISTSGSSENVLRAMTKASELGCKIIGLTGNKPELFRKYTDVTISIPSDDTARVQEMHIVVGHMLCDAVEKSIA